MRRSEKGYKNFFALLFTLRNKSCNVTFICDGDSFCFLFQQRKLMSFNENFCEISYIEKGEINISFNNDFSTIPI